MARAFPPTQTPTILDETEDLWDVALGARAGDRLEALVAFIDAYEAAVFPVVGPASTSDASFEKRERALDFA